MLLQNILLNLLLQIEKYMSTIKIPSVPIAEEDVSKILSSSTIERKQKQNALLSQCGVKTDGKTPFMNYVNHIQRINHLSESNDIQPALYSAIQSDPQAKLFLMAIS